MIKSTSMRVLVGVSGAILVSLGFTARADERLARERNCMACHSVGKKLVGPSFEAVAQRYAVQSGAQNIIITSMINGSTGKWGSTSMPAQPNLGASEAEKLAGWILSLQPVSPTR